MRKHIAVKIFGETQVELARAVNLTRARVCQWPDKLEPAQIDRVVGAAVRLGVPLPAAYTRPRRPRPGDTATADAAIGAAIRLGIIPFPADRVPRVVRPARRRRSR